MRRSRRITNRVLMCVFSSFIFLMLLMLVFAVSYRMTIGSESFIVKSFEASDYAKLTSDDIYKDLNLGAEIAGIDRENFFESIVPKSLIIEDIDRFFTQSISGQSPKADTSAFESLVIQGVNEYVGEKEISMDDSGELEENIQIFVDESVQTYRQWIELKFLPEAGKLLRLFDKPANISIIVLSVLICVLIFIAKKVLKNKNMLFDSCIMAVTGVLVFIAACILYAFAADIAGRLGIGAFALYSLVVSVIDRTVYASIVVAAALVLILILLETFKHVCRHGKGSLTRKRTL